MLERCKDNEVVSFSCEEIEKSIKFLSNILSDEWLTVYALGSGSVSIKVGQKKQGLSLFSDVIPLGLALIKLSKLKGFQKLVSKLTIQQNERLSSILEALCASRYKSKGYEIELEPPTPEGRYSDFRVKFGDYWVYFECKKEYPRESKYYKKLNKYVNEITKEILEKTKSKLPSEYRIDIIVLKRVQKDKIILVISRLCECLASREYNVWHEIDGLQFAVNSKDVKVALPSPLFVRQGQMTIGTKPVRMGEENTYFQIMYNPFGNKELQKIRRIIKEAGNQLPLKSKGVIILETLHPKRMLKVVQEKLLEPRYEHVIAVLVKGIEAWSVPNIRHSDFPLDFLKIAVQSA